MSAKRTPREVKRADAQSLERLLARVSVGAGGLFWMIAAFAGPHVFDNTSLAYSLGTAMWPLLATVVILVVGWFNEQFAVVLLTAASSSVLVWGVLYEWEPGLWVVMSIVLIAPMVMAALLFLLASSTDERSSIERRARERRQTDTHPDFRRELQAEKSI